MPLSTLRILLVALLATLWSAAAQAQVPPVPPAEETEAAPEGEPASDPLGRETPRGTVDGLLTALGTDDLELASAYLDLSGAPEELRERIGTRLAAALETVLDRSGEIVPSYRLSTEPSGLEDDGLVQGADVFAEVDLGEEEVELTVHRVPGPDGAEVWLVSPEALERVSRLVGATSVGLVDRITPEAWDGIDLAGAPLGHWIALAVLALLSLALARAAVGAGSSAVSHIRLFRGASGLRLARGIRLPLGVLLACILFAMSVRLLGISIVARAYVGPWIEIVAWLALAALAWAAVDAVATLWLTGMSRRGRLGAVSVVTLLRRAAKALVAFLAAVAIFTSLGVDLTGWLAAFGIGGLAIALGAQKTIEHLVGSVSLVADRPIRVGDFCQVDGVQGTVEDIGMRSTRLRTIERTLVTIPNGVLSSARIENYGSRDQYLFKRVLGLRYDTTAAQMREVLDRLRRLLREDPRVTDDPARVRFTAFGPSSLDVEIFAYVVAADYDEFLAIAEELHLAILEAVPACGADFAFPSQTVYLEGPGREDAARGAERRILGLRSARG